MILTPLILLVKFGNLMQRNGKKSQCIGKSKKLPFDGGEVDLSIPGLPNMSSQSRNISSPFDVGGLSTYHIKFHCRNIKNSFSMGGGGVDLPKPGLPNMSFRTFRLR